MKKLKIAQVVSLQESVPPQSKNGLEFVVSWLTEELVKRGHDVTLFAPANSITKAKLISLLPRGITQDHKTDWEQDFFSIWNTIIAASHSDTFDIIHCHNLNSGYITPFVSSAVVETAHHPYDDEFRSKYLENKEYSAPMMPILEAFSKVNYTAVSKFQSDQYKKVEPYFYKKHTAIHNGVPVDQFEYKDRPGNYLLYIGYINKNKGADVAVQVARNLNMPLILAGSNSGEEKFFAEHIEPCLTKDIRYVGPVNFEQKNDLYKNALVTLAPLQWDEPFGLILVESQACGTPVIAFDRGAAREIIADGKTGFIVKNETQMTEAVKKIKDIHRKDCRKWVEENFTIKKMVDAYEAFYASLTRD